MGPILNGGNLTSSVKDDRTSPARHVSPGALEFVLNDAAKINLPAGMENIAPAGTPVHMIGATQQQGVPWLGWSTQDPELLKQLDGPVTMSLNGFEGPGTMSTFLSGNFGSAGQQVFDSRSGGSFQVPANTHQHSNWVFTAEGRYTVTIGWTARLKNGQQVSSESVLHFTVGNPDNAPASNNAQGGAETKQDGGNANNANGANNGGEKSTAKNPVNGTVDEATGIVTKPDGSKVRIVGRPPPVRIRLDQPGTRERPEGSRGRQATEHRCGHRPVHGQHLHSGAGTRCHDFAFGTPKGPQR